MSDKIRFEMRINRDLIKLIDEWRRLLPDIPSRASAIRHLVSLALSRDKRIAELEEDNAQVCEWICKDSDILLYGGTCGTEWIFDEPPVGDYNYCPKCGRHIRISEGGGDE